MADVVIINWGWSFGGWGTTPWGGLIPYASGAVGTVTVVANANAYPSGLQATGGVGTVSIAAEANIYPTYRGWSFGGWGTTSWGGEVPIPYASGAVGTVTTAVNNTIQVTGLSGTTVLGTVTTTANATAYPVGVVATGLAGIPLVWGQVDDNQNPNWQNIDDTQSPGWGASPSAQSPNWIGVDAA